MKDTLFFSILLCAKVGLSNVTDFKQKQLTLRRMLVSVFVAYIRWKFKRGGYFLQVYHSSSYDKT